MGDPQLRFCLPSRVKAYVIETAEAHFNRMEPELQGFPEFHVCPRKCGRRGELRSNAHVGKLRKSVA